MEQEPFTNSNKDDFIVENYESLRKKDLILKIVIIILTILFLILLIWLIFALVRNSKNKNSDKGVEEKNELAEKMDKAGLTESWNNLYGIQYANLSYSEGKINNTFKEGGANYQKDIGNINDNEDYEKNEMNKYTLYIPTKVLDQKKTQKKNIYNDVMVFLHGGRQKKEDVEYLCVRYTKLGYITATIDFTDVYTGNVKHSNIFRNLDEITTCFEHIKKTLVEYINPNKLQLAIGGYSTGGHLALLYGTLMKEKSPIPIKFIINLVGFLSLEPQFWYLRAKYNDTLEDFEPETIDKAIQDKKIIGVYEDEITLLNYMNYFLGKRYKEEDLRKMMNDKKIDENKDEYQTLLKSIKYTNVLTYINNETVPILSLSTGNNEVVGVANFKFLRKKQKEYKNLKIDLVYMRYANHSLISYDNEDGINAMRDLNT